MTEKQLAESVYDILIELCGAPPDGKDSFVQAIVGGCQEYRCCPALGFGGKFYSDAFYVSYYIEDQTPKREAIRIATNERLTELLGLNSHKVV